MCCLAQEMSPCLLQGWLKSQPELSRCLLSTCSTGIRSYACAAAGENLVTRGRRDNSTEGRRGGVFLKDQGEQGTATEREEQPRATELVFSRDVSKQVPPDPSLNRLYQLEGSSPSWQKNVAQAKHTFDLFVPRSFLIGKQRKAKQH